MNAGEGLRKDGFGEVWLHAALGVHLHLQAGDLQSCFFWLHDAVCLRFNDGRVYMQEFS